MNARPEAHVPARNSSSAVASTAALRRRHASRARNRIAGPAVSGQYSPTTAESALEPLEAILAPRDG